MNLVVSRLLRSVGVIVGVTTAVFVVTRIVGDPVRAMLPLTATNEQRRQFAHNLGLDRPLWDQFVTFWTDLLHFDLGHSLWQKRPNLDIILEVLPRTFTLVTTGIILALVVSLTLGTVAALRPGGLIDRCVVTLSLLGLSAPQFWMGLMLVIVFSVWLDLVPTSGSGTPGHLILPAITIALPQTGRIAMMTRSALLDTMNSPYMRTLTLKGISTRRRILVHGFRNASGPILTLSAWEYVQGIAGYAVVVETVFAWPGIGYTALEAIRYSDLTLLQAIVLVTAVLVVVINLLVDVAYRLLDPRTAEGVSSS